MQRTIPEEHKSHGGIRRISPFGRMLAKLPLGSIPCPCCGQKALRFARVTDGRRAGGWSIICWSCGWTLPAQVERDSDALLNKLKRWCEAFALLGCPSDRVDEDLAALFDDDCSNRCTKGHSCCRYLLCFPRSVAVFPCRLHDNIFLPKVADDGNLLRFNVVELGVDGEGCYFRVDDEDGEKIRVEEIGSSVFLSKNGARAAMSKASGTPAANGDNQTASIPRDVRPQG